MGVLAIYVLIFLGMFYSDLEVWALPIIKGLKTSCYGLHADLNIGMLTPTTIIGGEFCSDTINPVKLSETEGAVWAIKKINARMDVLPNITLGFVVLNTCQMDRACMAQSLYFVPDTCDINNEAKEGLCTGPVQDKFKVVGIVGPSSSRESVITSSLLGIFHIPSVSPEATSDVLSDKSLYEYFLRVVPPDRFQIDMLFTFMKRMGWTYVSFLYSEGSYGENAYKMARASAKGKTICIPVALPLPILINEKIMNEIIDELLENRKARVVGLFINPPHQSLLFRTIERRGLIGTFVLISGDYMYGNDHGPVASGTFVSTFVSTQVPEYDEYFNSLDPIRDGSIWMRRLWEQTYGCKWDEKAEKSCWEVAEESRESLVQRSLSSVYMDAANAHAYALHNMFTELCPEVFSDKTLIPQCFNGPVYLKFLRNVSFDGNTGKVEFDSSGDAAAKFSVTQFQHDRKPKFKNIAYVDYLSDTFDTFLDEINWGFLVQENIGENGIPESVCSKPCKGKQYAIRLELICCWECRTCRENEIISANSSSCEKCPLLSWPDDDSQMICEDIEPTFLLWSDLTCVLLVSLAGIGFVLSILSYMWMFQNWNAKLVKASSRDLSSFTLAGCLFAFCTVFAFINRPSSEACFVSRIGFNLSVTMIFAPLLLKTNRVYRIFKAGQTGNAKPAMIGQRVQMMFMLGICVIQIGILAVTCVLAPPVTVADMKVPTEKYVEIYCDLPMIGLLPPLGLNLTVLVLCMLFGFLTRKLPENFNETWYIFVSGSTTMFLWVVFLPTYFTTFYATHKAILLAACLIINGVITIICLFVPKMYALRFLDEGKLNVKTAATVSTIATESTVGN